MELGSWIQPWGACLFLNTVYNSTLYYTMHLYYKTQCTRTNIQYSEYVY